MELDKALSEEEKQVLADCEATLQLGLRSALIVADALATIHSRRLYRTDYDSFEDYCRIKWEISRQHGYRLLTAAQVVQDVSPIGYTLNEAQARELAKLATPEQRRDALAVAVATAPDHQPTAQWISTTIEVLKVAGVTKGHVDVGDGEMTPLTAAVSTEVIERVKRQLEHIKTNSQWERKITVEATPKSLCEKLAQQLSAIESDEAIKVTVYTKKVIEITGEGA
jgi:hypothetical protein